MTGPLQRPGCRLAVLLISAVALALAFAPGAAARPRVLLVGTYHGHHGHFHSVQAAVNAAHPGDWILVGPGVYHERADHHGIQAAGAAYGERADYGDTAGDEAGAGVMIKTRDLHLRGMDRNRVLVDGTLPGSPRCSRARARQDFGPRGKDGKPLGRNGIEVYKASGVSIENLTVCNFLNGAGEGGNEVWFNGGDGSGKIGMGAYIGRWLSATSTYFAGDHAPGAAYGLFTSNSRGPGLYSHDYATNMNDSGFYVGACPDCHVTLDHVHAQYSILGYSGTNSGGHLVIEHSEWDHNQSGIVTNSQNNDDAPSPQSGRCPGRKTSCTFFRDNYVHDNNNPNVPSAGTAALGPVGTGVVIAGGRYDTISGNRIENNGSWGVLLVPYPDLGTPPPIAHCVGGQERPGLGCYYDDWANRVLGNHFRHNGFFGNPTNGDTGEVSDRHTPGNCYRGNTDPAGFTSSPANAQTTHADCSATNEGGSLASPVAAQAICNTQLLAPCPSAPGMTYPRTTHVRMPPLARQASMPHPCAGVPANAFCERPVRRVRPIRRLSPRFTG